MRGATQRGRRGHVGLSQRGYVLLLVMAGLALMALVAGRFAMRIDALREQTATMAAYARARLAADDAAAAALYLISTRDSGRAGFGPARQPELHADDRPYTLDIGGEVRLQDLRGLYPLNAIERESFAALLRGLGVDPSATDTYTDVLLDYIDTDSLKRLNGAEKDAYEALGLPPPRNDFLLSVRELNRMPKWRDSPELVAALEPLVSTGRVRLFNPNTAPRQLLHAYLPQARAEQLDLFETLRAAMPFEFGSSAKTATGLQLDREDFLFHVGEQYRLTVWAPGMPQALAYNVLLLPGGSISPWLVSEVHLAARPTQSNASDRATPFPMALAPARP